ncbi:MAG TPA: 2Fe-2S iron-sulfur cluster binding domain-containing protein, partial [Thermopetrobacter sp.]|nr:2Fe-2S iron-sulfur cluster binding domain-containing protein [Thermopetrobacter sp.]
MTRFTLDGRAIEAREGESILEAARRHGIEIPHLCHDKRLPVAGNCRACLVEIEGERVLAPSCARQPTEGMVVHSANERARRAQRGVLQLLLADTGAPADKAGDNELARWCDFLGVRDTPYARREDTTADTSHPALHFDPGACIRCTRCLRACHDLQGNDVIGLAYRGDAA